MSYRDASDVVKALTHVRITASVKSDERVTYEAPKQDTSASSQTITETIRDESYRWVNRHESSSYSEDGTGIIRDDAALGGPMEEEANSYRDADAPMGSRHWLSIPWVDFTYHAGDCIMGISGRGIELPSRPGEAPSYPMVEYVTYDFRLQQTRMQLRVGNP